MIQKLKPIEVLIAEDDALMNDGTAKQLERLGYVVAGNAYDGPQAVELTSSRRPGVILMDLQMIDPETGREDSQAGLKATRAIQERCPAPVVVLTAHESPELTYAASEAGANGYLVKPADDQELDRAITIARARFRDLVALRRLISVLQLRNEKLQATMTKACTLSGLVTVCANCQKARDGEGAWEELEHYVQARSNATFTHALCPGCAKELYPDMFPGIRKL